MARDTPKADYRVLFDYADGAEARLAQDRRHDYYQRVLPEMLKRLYGVPLAYDTYSKRWTPDSGKAPFWFRRNVTSPTGEKIPLQLNDAQDVVDFMTRQGLYKGQNGFNRGFGYLAPVFHQTRDQSPYLFVDLDVERPQFRGKSWRQLVKTTQRVHQWLEAQGFETLIVFTGSSFHLWSRKASKTWSYEEAKEVLTRMSQDLDIPLSEGKSHRRGQVTVDYARNMYLGPIRFPLSLHGTSGLSSVVVPADELTKFKPLKQAQPDWVLEHLPEQLSLLDRWFEKEQDFEAESTTSAADIIQQHLNTLDEEDIERCIWGECGILADQLMALLQAAGYREAVYEIGRAYIHPFEEYDDKTYIGGHVVVTVDGESYDALGEGAKERWVKGPVLQEILAENGFSELGPLLSAHLTVSWITSTWDEVMETRRHLFSGRDVSAALDNWTLGKGAETIQTCEGCGGAKVRRVRDLDQPLPVSLNLPRNPTSTCPLCLTYFAKGVLGHLCDDCDLRRKQEHEVHRLMVELVEQAPKLDKYGDGLVNVVLEIPTNSAGDSYQEINFFEEVTWSDLILDLPRDYYANERYFIPHVIETLERAQTEPGVWYPSWWASDGNIYEALKRWKKRRQDFIHLDRAEWVYFARVEYPFLTSKLGSKTYPRDLSIRAAALNWGHWRDSAITPLPVIVVSWPSTEYPDLKSRLIISPFIEQDFDSYSAETERFVDEQAKETFVKTFEEWSEKFLAGDLPLVAGGWGLYHNRNQAEPTFNLDFERMISDAGELDTSLGATFVSLDKDGLSTYVQNAIQYVENLLLNAQYAQGKLKLYRGIDLVNSEDFDPMEVGESWTPVRTAAMSYFGLLEEEEFNSYVLTALVPVDSINWYTTVLRALAFSHLEQDGIPLFDEKEIVLKRGAPIELVEVPLDLSFAIDGTPKALIRAAEISDDGYCSECGEHWTDIGKHPAIDGYEWSEKSVRKALERGPDEECWNCYAEFENLNEEDEEEFDYYTDMLRKDVVDAQTVKKYIESIHDGYFAWWSDLDDLEFTLQKVPLSVWEDMERSEVDGQWIDAPVYSHRLSDTLQQFRNQRRDDDYPPVVLKLGKSGNYEVIDGFHRLNALQILERENVMAWVGTPVVGMAAEEENDGKALFRSKYDKVLNDYLTYNPYTDREEWLEDIQWLIKHDDEEFFYTLKNLGKKEGKNLDSITYSEYLAMRASPRDPLILEAAEIMINRMLNHVDDLLDRAEYRDGKILLYREITLEDVADYDTTKLGVYWTPNIKAAEAYWGYGARGNNPYLIRAWVSFDDIDWNATWRANLHLPYECEFQLKSQVAVEVLPLTKRMSGKFVKRHPQTGLPIVSLDVVGPAAEPETLVYEVDSPIKDLLAVSEAGQFELIEALKDLPPELQRLTGVLELEDQPTRTGFASEQIFDYVPPQETVEWGFLRSSNRTAHPEGYVAQRYKNWSAPITGDLLDSFLENSLYHGTTETAWELTQQKGYFTPREPFESQAKTGKQSLEGKNLIRQIGTYATPVAGHAWQYAVGDWGPGSSKDRPEGGTPLVLKINPDEVRDLPWFIDLRDRAPSFFTTGRIPVEAVERVIEIPAEGPQSELTSEPFSWYEHPMMPLFNEGFDDPNPSYLEDKPKDLKTLRFWQEAIFEPGFLDHRSFEEKQRRVETFTGRPYETVEPCSCPDDRTYSSSDEVGKVWLTHPRKYGRTVPEGEHIVRLQESYPGMDQERKFQQEWWNEFERQLEDFYITQMGLTPAEFRLLRRASEDDESVTAFIRSENMGEPYEFNLWTRWWPKPRTPEEVARPYQDHTLEELMEGYRVKVGDWQNIRQEEQIRYTQLLSRLGWASESLDRTVGEAWNDAKRQWEDMVEWSSNHDYRAKASQDPLDVTAEEFEQALQYWNRITRVARRVGESGTVLGRWNEEDGTQGWSAYVGGETLLRLVEDENRAPFVEDVFAQYRQTGYINLAFYYFVLQVVLDLQWWLEDAWRGHGVPSRLATLDELLQPQSDATSVTAYRWVMAKRPKLQLSGGRSIPYGARKGARGWSYGSSWSLDPKAFTRTNAWEGSWEGGGRLDQYLEKQIPVNDIDWLGTLISCTLFRDNPEYEIIPAPGTFLAEEEGREEVVEYPVRLYHGTSLAAWEAIQDVGEMRAWSCFASDYGYGINMPETYIDLAIGGVPDTDEDRLRQGVVLELVFETEEEANQYLAPDMTMYDLGMAYLEDDLYDKYGLESGISSPWEWFQERFPDLVRQNKDTSKLPRLPSSSEDWQSSYLSVYAVALKRPVPASRLRRVE